MADSDGLVLALRSYCQRNAIKPREMLAQVVSGVGAREPSLQNLPVGEAELAPTPRQAAQQKLAVYDRLAAPAAGKKSLKMGGGDMVQYEQLVTWLGRKSIAYRESAMAFMLQAMGSSLKKAQTIPLPIGRLVKVLESHTVHPLKEWLHTEQAH